MPHTSPGYVVTRCDTGHARCARRLGAELSVPQESRDCSYNYRHSHNVIKKMPPAERIAGDSQQHLPVSESLAGTASSAGGSSPDDRPRWIPPANGILEGPPLSAPLPAEPLGVVLLQKLHSHGDKTALVDAVSGAETTYRDLLRECVSLAYGLQALVKDVHSADPPPQVVGVKGGKTRRFAGGSRGAAGPPADWSRTLREGRGQHEDILADGVRVVPPPSSRDETDQPPLGDEQEEKVVIGLFAENRKEVVQSFVASLLVGVPVTTLNPFSNTGELVRAWSVTNPALAMCSWDTFLAVLEASRSLPSLRHIVVFPGEVPDDVKQAAATDRSWDVQVSQFEQLLHGDKSEGDVDLEATLRDVAVPLQPAEHTAFLLHCNTVNRIARLTHRNFLYAVQLMLEPSSSYGWTSEDSVLLPVPLTHAFGLGICLGTLALGAKIVLMPAFREQLFLATAHSYNVTQLVLMSPQTSLLARSPLLEGAGAALGPRGLAGALCAAAPLPRALHRDLARRLQLDGKDAAEPRQAYGLTQATCSLVIAPRGAPPDTQGRLVPGAQAKIVDAASGKVVRPLQVGELQLRAPSIMAGYYLDKEATLEALDTHGWLRTGDLAYYDHNGFIFVVDRLKDVMLYTRVHFKQFDHVDDGEEPQRN